MIHSCLVACIISLTSLWSMFQEPSLGCVCAEIGTVETISRWKSLRFMMWSDWSRWNMSRMRKIFWRWVCNKLLDSRFFAILKTTCTRRRMCKRNEIDILEIAVMKREIAAPPFYHLPPTLNNENVFSEKLSRGFMSFLERFNNLILSKGNVWSMTNPAD